ncbi:MAG TPA: amidase, partial [Pirellulales bacterium]
MAVSADAAWSSIRGLGKRLRASEFTAVELAEFFLDRIERIGKPLNAIVTVTRALAIEQARRADAELAAGHDRGPLHGIPYGAKDLLATAGIATSWGAAPLKHQIFDQDATVVRRLREAGAVLVAKLAMVEIAGGLGYEQANASFTGPGLNPWDTQAWSGGSSSGSGSAVAAGVVPFAIGSETWGSIMTPAGYCGISGLRPTYGRVSRHGAMALSWSIDKLGPLARTADDCGLVLQAIAGFDPADPSSADRPYRYSADELPGPPFRLATLKGAADRAQPEVRRNFEAALERLRPHATWAEIDLPDFPYGTVTGTIISCEMAAA